MHNRLLCHLRIAIWMIIVGADFAYADDTRLFSDPRSDLAVPFKSAEPDSWPIMQRRAGIFEDGTDLSIPLDPTDPRQMDLLYSDLMGVTPLSPAVKNSDSAQPAAPQRLAPVIDTVTASSNGRGAPANALRR